VSSVCTTQPEPSSNAYSTLDPRMKLIAGLPAPSKARDGHQKRPGPGSTTSKLQPPVPSLRARVSASRFVR